MDEPQDTATQIDQLAQPQANSTQDADAIDAQVRAELEAGNIADAPQPAAPEEPPRDEHGRFIPVNRHTAILNEQREQAAAKIAELEKELSSARNANPAKIAELEAMRAEYGNDFVDRMTTALSARDQQIAALKQQVTESATREQARQQVEAQSMQREVDEAIAHVPVIGQWRDAGTSADATPEEQALWKAAVAYDEQMKQMPHWARKPMAERFEAVKRRVADDFGIELPEASTQAPQPDAARRVPSSLSNIPSGQSPRTTRGTSEGQSVFADLQAAKGMTQAQLERYLLMGG